LEVAFFMGLTKKTPLVRTQIDVIDADPHIGLSSQEVAAREESGWVNGLTISASRTEGQIIAHNCFTFFNLVFVVLAVIVALGGSSVKNMTFLIIVICNTVIGCYQEIRAKRAVDKLTLVAAQQLRVCRDGALQILRSDLLVRDDIVEFVSGDQICADGILRTGQLQVNEALITGEEDPVVKNPGDTLRSGSFVIAGTGRAQLTRVGRDSYAARLAAEAKANPTVAKSEMMNALDKLIHVLVHADFVGMIGHIVNLIQRDIPDAGQLVFLPLGIGHEQLIERRQTEIDRFLCQGYLPPSLMLCMPGPPCLAGREQRCSFRLPMLLLPEQTWGSRCRTP
jgi:magnesium-transporting ATPase (P-type)